MKSELKIENITLFGAFKPSNFDRYFFEENKIIEKDLILENSSFLDDVVKIITPSFRILINDFQFLIAVVKPEEGNKDIVDVVQKIIKLKDLNLVELGINFHWFIIDENNSIRALSKKMFFNSNNKVLNEHFNNEENDIGYGFYSSMNIFGSRLKLDVKPVTYIIKKGNLKFQALRFEFNFHKDYKESSIIKEELLTLFDQYEKMKEKSKQIVLTACNYGN